MDEEKKIKEMLDDLISRKQEEAEALRKMILTMEEQAKNAGNDQKKNPLQENDENNQTPK
jgi:hypothetical protein